MRWKLKPEEIKWGGRERKERKEKKTIYECSQLSTNSRSQSTPRKRDCMKIIMEWRMDSLAELLLLPCERKKGDKFWDLEWPSWIPKWSKGLKEKKTFVYNFAPDEMLLLPPFGRCWTSFRYWPPCVHQLVFFRVSQSHSRTWYILYISSPLVRTLPILLDWPFAVRNMASKINW